MAVDPFSIFGFGGSMSDYFMAASRAQRMDQSTGFGSYNIGKAAADIYKGAGIQDVSPTTISSRDVTGNAALASFGSAINTLMSQNNAAISQYNDAVAGGAGTATSYYNQALNYGQRAMSGLEESPYSKSGELAMTELSRLTSMSSSATPDEIRTTVENLPGYKFQFEQGQQALERSQAAKGLSTSGNALAEAVKYGQGFAQSAYQGHLQNLGMIAQLGQPFGLKKADIGMQLAGMSQQQGQYLANLGAQTAGTRLGAQQTAASQTAAAQQNMAQSQLSIELANQQAALDAAKANQAANLAAQQSNQQAKTSIATTVTSAAPKAVWQGGFSWANQKY